MNLGIKWVTEQHAELLERFDERIDIRVNCSVKDMVERDDVKQHVKLEIIKAFKNHRKYADWDNIVLSIIKRRIRDYKKRNYKNPLYENSYGDDTGKSAQESIDAIYFRQGKLNQEDEKRIEKTDLLEQLWMLVGENAGEFTEWELDYMGALYDAYDNDMGFETEPERMELMGVDATKRAETREFRIQVQKFTAKVREIRSENQLA